jgi:hypothetical protein
VVEGFQPIMPTFKGLLNEEQLLQLTAYVRSLGAEGQTGGATSGPNPTQQAAGPDGQLAPHVERDLMMKPNSPAENQTGGQTAAQSTTATATEMNSSATTGAATTAGNTSPNDSGTTAPRQESQ